MPPKDTTLTPFNPATDTARTKEEAFLVRDYNLANRSPIIQTTTDRRSTTQERSTNLDTRLTGTMNNVANTQGSYNPNAPQPDTPNFRYDPKNPSGQGVKLDNAGNPITTPGEQTSNPDSFQSKYDAQFGEGSYDKETASTRDAKAKIAEYDSQLERLKVSQNASTNALISSIRQVYGARIAKMQDANHRLLETKRVSNFKNNRARYTPVSSAGILTSEEIAGHERIGTLEAAMMQEIAKAEQARADGDLKMFNERFDYIESVEKKLQDEIMNQHKRVIDTDNARRQQEAEERLQEKNANDLLFKKAETAAPGIAKAISGYKTDAEKLKFIEAYAAKTGIDVDVIRGEVEKAGAVIKKDALSEQNVRNQMYNRNRSGDLNQTKYADDKEEKATKSALTKALLRRIKEEGLSIDDARLEWSGYNLSQKDFDTEFAAMIEGL